MALDMVTPSTVIYICQDIPLDINHEVSITFTSPLTQFSYFTAKAKYTLTQLSYQRIDKGSIRVELNAEAIYGCNYMVISNFGHITISAQENPQEIPIPNTEPQQTRKWYIHSHNWTQKGSINNDVENPIRHYCFITDVTYINNDCCEISYVEDVLQTYLHEFEVNDCFVERMHPLYGQDYYAGNTIPEDINYGELVCIANEDVTAPKTVNGGLGTVKFTLLAGGNEKQDEDNILTNAASTYISNNVMLGMQEKFIGETDELIELLNKYITNGKEGNIILIQSIPERVAPTTASGDYKRYVPTINVGGLLDTHAFKTYVNGSLEEYKPFYTKLRIYPYHRLIMTNNQGSTKEYKIELFKDLTQSSSAVPNELFAIYGAAFPTAEMFCLPLNYGGIYENFTEGLMYHCPTGAVIGSTYQQWVAQNLTNGSALISTLGGALSSIANGALTGLLTGNPLVGAVGAGISAGTSMLGQAFNLSSTGLQAWAMPDTVRGQVDSHSIIPATKFGFSFYHYAIRNEYAMLLDRYFSRYGYKWNTVIQPVGWREGQAGQNPCWNYIKTNGCTIRTAHMPASAKQAICDIFDKGITFWHEAYTSFVGRYDAYMATNHGPRV